MDRYVDKQISKFMKQLLGLNKKSVSALIVNLSSKVFLREKKERASSELKTDRQKHRNTEKQKHQNTETQKRRTSERQKDRKTEKRKKLKEKNVLHEKFLKLKELPSKKSLVL